MIKANAYMSAIALDSGTTALPSGGFSRRGQLSSACKQNSRTPTPSHCCLGGCTHSGYRISFCCLFFSTARRVDECLLSVGLSLSLCLSLSCLSLRIVLVRCIDDEVVVATAHSCAGRCIRNIFHAQLSKAQAEGKET